MTRTSSQGRRAGYFLSYWIVVALINGILFQEFLPTGLWFWSAFLALLLGEFISQPYFTAPKDALANSVTTIATVVALLAASPQFAESLMTLWHVTLVIATIIMGFALVALLMGNSTHPRRHRFSEFARDFARLFGSPKVMFTGIFFLTLYTFHIQKASEVFFLSLTWVVFVIGTPFESLHEFWQRIRKLWTELSEDSNLVGHVVLRREPGLITINVTGEDWPSIGQLVAIPTTSTHGELGVILDNYRLSDQLWSRALVFAARVPKDDLETGWGKENTVLRGSLKTGRESWLEREGWKNRGELIGPLLKEAILTWFR